MFSFIRLHSTLFHYSLTFSDSVFLFFLVLFRCCFSFHVFRSVDFFFDGNESFLFCIFLTFDSFVLRRFRENVTTKTKNRLRSKLNRRPFCISSRSCRWKNIVFWTWIMFNWNRNYVRRKEKNTTDDLRRRKIRCWRWKKT